MFVAVLWLVKMSSRGRDNGRGNKRKYPEHNSFSSKRRNFEEEFPRNDRRWNDKFHYNANNKTQNQSSRNDVHSRLGYRSSQHYQSSSHRHFDYPPPISTDSHIEQDKETAELNTERLEKVLATKKRIEEAFATKSSTTSNQEKAFEKPVMKETSVDNKDKNTDGGVTPVDSLDLRLTNSDFKEIGSVASGVAVEGETDVGLGDLILNIASHSSQQRSFDKVAPTIIPSLSKQPRVGGWNVTALSNIETGPLFATPHAAPPRTSRAIREQYLQASREEILGSIVPDTEEQSLGLKKTKAGCGNQKSPSMSVSRVGQLYQSFLRSRLFGGFTLQLSKNTSKPIGPNPLLDKSVLESHNNYNSIPENQTLHLEMPRPIMIKLEANKATDLESTPNCTEAEEANEFCQEFSYLLTEPNFLIPAEELEKLGLGHLAEMNKLVDERRNSAGSSSMSVNSESYLRVRSLNALNSVTENDITYNPSTSNITPSSLPESPLNNNFSNTSHVQNRLQDMNYEFVNVPGPNQAQLSGMNSQVLTNPQPSINAQDATLQDIHTPVADILSGNVLFLFPSNSNKHLFILCTK